MTSQLKRRDVLIGAGALLAAGPAMAQPTPAEALTQVLLQTDAGDIVIGLETVKAPVTAANFLHYVDQKRYTGGNFYRAMRTDMPTNGDWGLIQGVSDPKKPRFPGVAHEPTTQTGLSNVEGAVTIANGGAGTATSDFFICAGDMSALDADPKDPSNIGFAVFGRVLSGMDVVKKIQAMPTVADAEIAAMKGQILATPVKINLAKRVTA